ncbi:Hypothetical_protein [Hexamita inflata]|uniref:Hypothetical_protein n=1 Tax=Hexamita inflata TaxID=28002 RepID=A0AA86TSN2_9EUKA|nr:Hypothetical protein HINF_LOCUS8538 [Hexamita inflata]
MIQTISNNKINFHFNIPKFQFCSGAIQRPQIRLPQPIQQVERNENVHVVVHFEEEIYNEVLHENYPAQNLYNEIAEIVPRTDLGFQLRVGAKNGPLLESDQRPLRHLNQQNLNLFLEFRERERNAFWFVFEDEKFPFQSTYSKDDKVIALFRKNAVVRELDLGATDVYRFFLIDKVEADFYEEQGQIHQLFDSVHQINALDSLKEQNAFYIYAEVVHMPEFQFKKFVKHNTNQFRYITVQTKTHSFKIPVSKEIRNHEIKQYFHSSLGYTMEDKLLSQMIVVYMTLSTSANCQSNEINFQDQIQPLRISKYDQIQVFSTLNFFYCVSFIFNLCCIIINVILHYMFIYILHSKRHNTSQYQWATQKWVNLRYHTDYRKESLPLYISQQLAPNMQLYQQAAVDSTYGTPQDKKHMVALQHQRITEELIAVLYVMIQPNLHLQLTFQTGMRAQKNQINYHQLFQQGLKAMHTLKWSLQKSKKCQIKLVPNLVLYARLSWVKAVMRYSLGQLVGSKFKSWHLVFRTLKQKNSKQ